MGDHGDLRGQEEPPATILWDLSSQAGGRAQAPVVGVPSRNHWTNREPQTPGNINQSEAPQRSSSQHQDPALTNCLETPLLDVAGQTTSKTRIQHHPSKKKRKKRNDKKSYRASLVAHWLRICLPMQGTRVRALAREDPTCRGATRPVSHDY